MILLLVACSTPEESPAQSTGRILGDGASICLWKGTSLDCRFLSEDTTNYGQNEAPAGDYADVSVGNFSMCAVDRGGALSCWGGDGLTIPVAPAPPGSWVDTDVEDDGACAIAADHSVTCWGNATEQLTTPPSVTNAASVSRLGLNSCLLDTAGKVTCWGQMANGVEGYVLPPDGKWTSLVGQGYNGCVLDSDGYASCFGLESTDVPGATPTSTQFDRLTLGWRHACGITRAGPTVCWGSDTRGQTVPPAREFVDLASGSYFSCGMEGDGTITCWGCGGEGECDWEHPLDLPRFGQ